MIGNQVHVGKVRTKHIQMSRLRHDQDIVTNSNDLYIKLITYKTYIKIIMPFKSFYLILNLNHI